MPLPTPSRNEGRGLVGHREGFETPHKDTVGDDESDEYRELFGGIIGVGFQHLIDYDHESGNHYELHDDTDVCRNGVAKKRDDDVGECRTAITDTPMTIDGSSLAVTARTEQIPRICTTTGLFLTEG